MSYLLWGAGGGTAKVFSMDTLSGIFLDKKNGKMYETNVVIVYLAEKRNGVSLEIGYDGMTDLKLSLIAAPREA